MLHVRQLVSDHAFELLVREDPQNPFGGGHRRVLRVAARRERIGRRLRNDVDPRHRQTGARRELADDPSTAGDPGPTSWALYSRSTILSENQYEPRFVATASTKPNISPCAPPSTSPRNRNRALIAPSSNAVFTVLGMVSILL